MLWTARARLNPPRDGGEFEAQQRAIMEQRALDPSLAFTKFLWGSYKPETYYFEVEAASYLLFMRA